MATFRTAYLQRAIPLDVAVVNALTDASGLTAANRRASILRGDFVVYTPAAGTVPAYITKATAAQVANRTATHFVAQADVTMMGNHVSTDLRDYRYSPVVTGTITSGTPTATTPKKKVALYSIFNWNDIVPDADGMDNAG